MITQFSATLFLSIFSATDGSCAMVGGISRSVPSSPGERSDKFGQEEGSQGCLDRATEIRFQNKPARERRSLLLRSKEALEVTVPQISVWTHVDSEGGGDVWTGPGPADTDTGVWSSDPDSSVPISSASTGRQHSLDSPPVYHPSQYHSHPYQTVPSLNTPSPPESSSNYQTFSSPSFTKPNQTLSLSNATSLIVQSSYSSEQQFSMEDSVEKEDNEMHICRCRSSEPLNIPWSSRNSPKSSVSPTADPLKDSGPPSPASGSSTNVDLVPSVCTVNQQDLSAVVSPGVGAALPLWQSQYQTAPGLDPNMAPNPLCDSRSYYKKTLP